MLKSNLKIWFVSLLILSLSGCNASSDSGINKSIRVGDGEHRPHGLRSVNGSITVGNSAVIEGNCSTVNGGISIGEAARVGEVTCVNGGIHLERNSEAVSVSCVNGAINLDSDVNVKGDVVTVNGTVTCQAGTQITGNLENVNGAIHTEQTFIKGDISTRNGKIVLAESSRVRGSILIDRTQKISRIKPHKPLIITVKSNSKVMGDIIVKGKNPQVTVILSDGGEVLGEISNAEIIRK